MRARRREAGWKFTGSLVVPLIFANGCVDGRKAPAFAPEVSVEVLDEIGSQDRPGLVFGLISDVEVLADGSFLVLDRGRAEVLHVSPRGELIAAFGGEGGGPAEFAGPLEIDVVGPDAYVVLNGDRPYLTHVAIEGASHEHVANVPLPFMALHLCGTDGGFVLDPVMGSHALAKADREGSILREYHRVPDPLDESFPPEAQGLMRMWEGMAIPRCLPGGGVLMLSQWSPFVGRFAADGTLNWSIDLAEYRALHWEAGPDGSPEPTIPDGESVHQGATIIPLGTDLLLVQLIVVTDDAGAVDDDPAEIRLVRPSDGSQSRHDIALPRIAHVEEGRAYGWSNSPYPRLVLMSLDVSLN